MTHARPPRIVPPRSRRPEPRDDAWPEPAVETPAPVETPAGDLARFADDGGPGEAPAANPQPAPRGAPAV